MPIQLRLNTHAKSLSLILKSSKFFYWKFDKNPASKKSIHQQIATVTCGNNFYESKSINRRREAPKAVLFLD